MRDLSLQKLHAAAGVSSALAASLCRGSGRECCQRQEVSRALPDRRGFDSPCARREGFGWFKNAISKNKNNDDNFVTARDQKQQQPQPQHITTIATTTTTAAAAPATTTTTTTAMTTTTMTMIRG